MPLASEPKERDRQRPALPLRRFAARLLSRSLRRRHFGWRDLTDELDRCRAAVTFWWRDDDAVAATPQLDRLLALRAELGLPIALAVIPAQLENSLVARLRDEAAVAVLQHGWRHTNHAPCDAPPSEFPAGRPLVDMQAELSHGRRRLEAQFAARFIPALVPPFNALAKEAVDAVGASGLPSVSLATDFAGLALSSRNVHVDLIDWRSGRAVPAEAAIRSIVLALRLRRFGLTEATRPIGIMTHHLVHDEGIWALTRDVLVRLAAHPKVAFAPIEGIFA